MLDIGPLFKGQDVLPPDLAKPRSRAIECYNDRITLKFDRYLGSATDEVPVKRQGDLKSTRFEKKESGGLETSRDLTIRRPSA